MDTTDIIRSYYDAEVETEWERIAGRPEFLLTCRYLSRYIRPGHRVLDIGGGPGRYSLWLAQQGCDVTLLDLSPENVRFAQKKAAQEGLALTALTGDARRADAAVEGTFDCVLLMGPLYHLLEEGDRVQAVEAALRRLKPGGVFFASFINLFAGMIFAMKFDPTLLISENAAEQSYHQCVLEDRSYAGEAFTRAFFIRQEAVVPFMAQFPLEKLHLFGQEGITSPCEGNIMTQPKEVVEAWLDAAEQLAERPDLLSWAEHLMYVGRRK